MASSIDSAVASQAAKDFGFSPVAESLATGMWFTIVRIGSHTNTDTQSSAVLDR